MQPGGASLAGPHYKVNSYRRGTKMKGNATRLGNVVINDTEAIALVEKVMAGALEHKEEYEKMVVNLAGGGRWILS